MDRVPRGVPLWSGVGKSGDLGDRPADKISACSDQGPEVRRISRPDHRDCCVLPFVDRFLMPSYCTPLSGLCLISSISRLTLGCLVAPSQVFCLLTCVNSPFSIQVSHSRTLACLSLPPAPRCVPRLSPISLKAEPPDRQSIGDPNDFRTIPAPLQQLLHTLLWISLFWR